VNYAQFTIGRSSYAWRMTNYPSTRWTPAWSAPRVQPAAIRNMSRVPATGGMPKLDAPVPTALKDMSKPPKGR
jgi:hypothetical protein